MGVTNGFLRLAREEFQELESDESAFAARCSSLDESNGYLYMDKAGYELLFMIDPSVADPESSLESPYPNIAAVLGGGRTMFPNLDLGLSPAQVIDETALRQAVPEFDNVDFETMLERATDPMVADVLMVEINEEEFRHYHWGYLRSLGEFIREAVAADMVVLRY